ncbi:MAG: ATP-dependent zinc metalloprotease FtsH [Clostridia bacterium]|nr:ATP-dependent zinc metalloprotease FtsH [Clostridia bacterium]
MKKKSNIFPILIYIAIIAIVIFAIASIISGGKGSGEKLVYSDVIDLFEQNQVFSFVMDENNYTITLEVKKIGENGLPEKDEEGNFVKEKITYELSTIEEWRFRNQDFPRIAEELGDKSILESEEYIKANPTPWYISNLPLIIMVVLFVVFMIFTLRQANGGKMMSFGKSKARTGAPGGERVTFADVAGADEEKEELEEVVAYLKNPSKFTRLGAKIPHGVLLVGPPGTGKTLLAKAVAGEAGVPFFSMSGSDFVEMYVGVGASRVRDLFENARKSPAAIIFIDEIDAVGRQRGAGLGGGHDEREQTLNQLLVEMDGFDGHSGIIVMAATNRPDILDSALLRPGRFDRQITIGYPDIEGREQILKVHAKDKPFEETVDLHKIAQTTVGFTGADLANLLNEAALLAARRNKNLIGMAEIEDSWVKVSVGTQKKSRMTEKEKRNTAIHEAGHAILAHLLPTQDPVRQISIIPSGRALGYTLTPPTEDKYSESRQEMIEGIAVLLGGRIAERLIFDDYTGGASNDIQRATEVARKMVTQYGMSDELGTIRFGSHNGNEVFLGRDFGANPDYSSATAAKIDAEIKKIIDHAYEMATKILTENKDKLEFIADFLLKHEIMDDEQFALAMKDGVTMEELEGLVTEKKRRSEEENKRIAERKEAERRTLLEERRRMERELGIIDDDDEPTVVETEKTVIPEEKTELEETETEEKTVLEETEKETVTEIDEVTEKKTETIDGETETTDTDTEKTDGDTSDK